MISVATDGTNVILFVHSQTGEQVSSVTMTAWMASVIADQLELAAKAVNNPEEDQP